MNFSRRVIIRGAAAALLLLLPLLLLPACKSDPTRADFYLRVMLPPLVEGGLCPDSGDRPVLDAAPGVTRLRFTFYLSGQGGFSPDTFVCDRVFTFQDTSRQLYVDADADTPLDLTVEAFGPDANNQTVLKALGSAGGITLKSTEQASVMLWPVGEFNCAAQTMTVARAFHSATVLPSGRVLILGGAIAAPEGSTATAVDLEQGLFLTGSADVWDPEQGTFIELDVDSAGVPRAFHSAYLLPGSTAERGRIVVIGGVGQGTTPASEGPLQFRRSEEPLRINPHPSAEPAPPETLAYYDFGAELQWEGVVEGDARASTPGMFQTSTFMADMVWATGGATSFHPVNGLGLRDGVWAMDAEQVGTVALGATLSQARAGHTLTDLGSDRLMLWGGNLETPADANAAVELVGLSSDRQHLSLMSLTHNAPASTAPFDTTRVFHTATALPSGEVLLVGGFEVQTGPAGPQATETVDASSVLTRIAVDTNTAQFTLYADSAAPDPFPATGYHAATLLPDGSVLVTGGTPASNLGAALCDASAPYLCAINQAIVVQPGSSTTFGQLEIVTGGLMEPRFGHAQVMVPGVGVLVTGGLRREAGELFTVAAAEVYVPTSFADPVLDPLSRQPGDVLDPERICPVYEEF